MDAELTRFKTEIDLRLYAASLSYQLDRKESWAGSAVMRHPNDDKIIIKRDADRHYVYFSVRDETDNGTIIDFAMRRLGVTLGLTRKALREFMGLPQPVRSPYSPLAPVPKDRICVERAYAGMRTATRHPYLEDARGIPAPVLGSRRFAGCVRIDMRGNAVFPHFDAEGLCGFEIKNTGFTGFSPGGTKGLWLSHQREDDNRLVLCESAIDALSYAALAPDDRTRYASIGGKPNPLQPELIRAAVSRMPVGSEIVSAMDADAEGAKLGGIIRRTVELSGRDDLHFSIEEPCEFKDWNDQLRAALLRSKPVLPYRPEEPSGP